MKGNAANLSRIRQWCHGCRLVFPQEGLAACCALLAALQAPAVTETFDAYANGTALTAVGGGGVWTIGSNTVTDAGGVAGSKGLSNANPIFNWKGQAFQWSTLAVGTKLTMALDFQTSATGKFDDDRVGWTITPDASTSTGSQMALQLDNTTEAGMVVYWNSTRTQLNALSSIKTSTWYRFVVEFTKLTATSAGIVGTLTELDASGTPTGTPYVGTVADTSTFSNPPATTLFGGSQCPSFKNYSGAAGNADNASFTLTPPSGNLPPTVAITSPINGATVGTSVTIEVTAADSDGTITSVTFYDGTTLLGTDTSSPYSYAWSGAAPGSHALTARAMDNGGLTTTSNPVTVTVAEPVVDYVNFTGGTHAETFDSLGAVANGTVSQTPLGWFVGYDIAAPAWTTNVTANDGSTGVNATAGWNCGISGTNPAADRALAIGNSSSAPAPSGNRSILLKLKNSTGRAISSFTLAYDLEQWRSFDGSTTPEKLTLAFSPDNVNWVDLGPAFNGTLPVGPGANSPRDGNAPAYRVANLGGAYTCPALVPAGSFIYLRWYDTNESGTDGINGIDNFSFSVATPANPIQYVIIISVDGLGGTYLSKLFDGTATGGPYAIPNFTRLKNEGAGTLAAHCDNNTYETLPNHTSILTARPRDNSPGFDGHNWTSNSDPAVGQTIHSNKGSYVASGFDVAHDHGLRTGMYANKSKFSLFDTYGSYTGGGSYSATYGALDTTGADNGRDKLDNTYINATLGGIVVDTFITQQQSASPNQYAFLHINETDYYGHNGGWGSALWNSQAVVVDTMLGKIFKLIEQEVPAMTGNTAILLTADHGNQDNPPTGADRYAVPFYVWGPGVPAGADLYTLNPATRQVAATYPMTTYANTPNKQPIRNAEASNVALKLLGLGPIPGSTFNFAQTLVVTQPGVTLGLAGSPLAEAGGGATVTATLSTAHSMPVTVNLTFSGTATLTADYARSATGIAIAAGSTTGSLTLTAVQDALVENPDETIVVDIASVVNGTESGTQQVTATITDAATAPFAIWIHDRYPTLTEPWNRPDADPDGDGLDNAIEYVLGSNPDAATTNRPTAATDGGDFVFSFQRALVSKEPGTAVAIDVGSSPDHWPPASVYVVGTAPEVTVGTPTGGYEAITLRVPRTSPKLFARLRVTIAP